MNEARKDLPAPVRPFLPVALAKFSTMTELQAVTMARSIVAFGDSLKDILPPTQ